MKICLIGNFGKSYGQICDETHIANALRALGHEVKEIQREQFAFISAETNNFDTDFTIFFKWRGFVPEDIDRWKLITKKPVLAWTFDYMKIHDYFFPVLQRVDLWLGEELGLLPEWEKMGIKFHYFPNHAIPPDVFRKVDSVKEYDVSFTGTHFAMGGRVELLTEVNKNCNLHVFGNGFEGWATDVNNAHPPAFDDNLSEVVAKSKIILGINVNNWTPGYWSIRPAQVMMCGGFMLQMYVPYMERELKDGCAYFHNPQEAVEKIKYYLSHELERQKIANRGYEIAHQSLTSDCRARELTTLLNNYPFNKIQ